MPVGAINVVYQCTSSCTLVGVLQRLGVLGRSGNMLVDRSPTKEVEMATVRNGETATLRELTWTKSSYSNPNGNCVELAELPGEMMAVRNSRHPAGPALIYPRAELAAFVRAVKEGEFPGTTG